MPLLKSYVKEKSPSPPLKKGESDRPSVCSGCQCTSVSWNLRAMVQKEATLLVLRATQAAAIFFYFYAQIWPLRTKKVTYKYIRLWSRKLTFFLLKG